MAQHISRKELKKDEIRDTLAHGAEAVFSHQRLAGIILGVALVVGLAVVGWRFYTERQTVKAAAALGDGMKIFEARIRVPGEPAEPNEVTYVDEKNKYEDAAKKFDGIARSYGRTRPGQIARYYAALSQLHLRRFDDAQKQLKELEDAGDPEFVALARFQLAGIYGQTGKGDEAVKLYRQLADKPTAMVPKPMVLLALGDQLRKSNPQEATTVYNQIKKDFPDSPVAEEAGKRLEALGPRT
ncbi:MAG: tetratricopeptide repeat protein [Acidobacteria bacterium]|nr:tetratricopeptide repeat protein [Acidobacteriota bacterium]